MSIERRAFLTGAAAVFAGSAARAQNWEDYKDPKIVAAEPKAPLWPSKERFPLWPGLPPGAPKPLPRPGWQMFPDGPQLWVKGIAMPEVNVFRPALADGSALLVIPGGSYHFHAVQNEGLHPAERFNAERTTVFVLSYRLPGEGWANRSIAPLSDAQRAMRLIRSRAAEFKIDPNRLGVLGFSAGGHLAADLTVSYAERVYTPVDAADQLSAKPSFTGLIYPVATFQSFTHAESRANLLGPNPPGSLIQARSPELHINGSTPPCFVVHAFDDGAVPIENSLAWIRACQAAKVSVEAHLIAEGGHGFGLHLPADNPGSRWPDLFALWMRKHGG
nr:alpha/beta hydrolase [Sphingomonas sp.]